MTDNIIDVMVRSGRATGPDLSYYNQYFSKTALQQLMPIVDLAVIRAGGANDARIYKDSKFDFLYGELLEPNPNIVRGCYWYYGSGQRWEDQFEFFIETLRGKEFDFIAGDMELFANTPSAAWVITGARWIKHVADETYTPTWVYSNKPIYEAWLKKYSSEYDTFDYWHAQYPWVQWNPLNAVFMRWFENLLIKNTEQPYLPKTQQNCRLWQIGAKTGLGKVFGTAMVDMDFNVSMGSYDEFCSHTNIAMRHGGVIPQPDTVTVDLDAIEESAQAILRSVQNMRARL